MLRPLHAQVLKRPKDPAVLMQMKETVLKYALFQIRDAMTGSMNGMADIRVALPSS